MLFLYNKDMNKLQAFKSLANIFEKHGYQLFLVGGTVRDFLLKRELNDIDCATDATPKEIKDFLSGDFTFAKFGSIKVMFEDVKFEITTFREENNYTDSRHPAEIKFVRDIEIDFKRRDFSINAMYLDKNEKVYDFTNGQKDLKNKILTMIGDSDKRIKEDPLRIIRAVRFALDYDLTLDFSLFEAIKNNNLLLLNLNIEKIKMDLNKMKCNDKEKINTLFSDLGIKYLLDMIE